MMICNRPVRVFDVDVIGAGVFTLLLLSGYFGIIVPAGSHARAHQRLAGELRHAEESLDVASERLTRMRRDIELLESAIGRSLERAPRAAQRAHILSRIVGLADETGLRLHEVVPQPLAAEGALTFADARIAGVGTLPDVVRFLTALARELPGHSIESLTVRAPSPSDQPRCTIEITLRMRLLPDEFAPITGARP